MSATKDSDRFKYWQRPRKFSTEQRDPTEMRRRAATRLLSDAKMGKFSGYVKTEKVDGPVQSMGKANTLNPHD